MKFPLLKIIRFGCSYTAIEEVITSDLKHIDFRRYVDTVVLNSKQRSLGFNQIIPESLIKIKLDYSKKKVLTKVPNISTSSISLSPKRRLRGD